MKTKELRKRVLEEILENILIEIANHEHEVKKLKDERNHWVTLHAHLSHDPDKEEEFIPSTSVFTESKPKLFEKKPGEPPNWKIVQNILTAMGRKLRESEIAKIAFEEGLIKSAKGYDGVKSTVHSIVYRGRDKHFLYDKVSQTYWNVPEKPQIELLGDRRVGTNG